MVCLLKIQSNFLMKRICKRNSKQKVCVDNSDPADFLYSLIREAHDSIRQKDMSKITDDAMVVEQETGAKVALAEDLIRILRSQHRRILISRKHFETLKNVL